MSHFKTDNGWMTSNDSAPFKPSNLKEVEKSTILVYKRKIDEANGDLEDFGFL